jgi:hypothetical protein
VGLVSFVLVTGAGYSSSQVLYMGSNLLGVAYRQGIDNVLECRQHMSSI